MLWQPTRGIIQPNRHWRRPQTVAGGGFTPTSTESSDFLARTSGLSDADKTLYDTLITGLVNDGIFVKLDVLYILAAPDRVTACLNLVQNAYNATEVLSGGPVNFTAYRGYTGNSTFRLDSNFNPGLAPTPKFMRNSASFGIYDLSNTAGAGINMGAAQNGDTRLIPNFFGNFHYNVNGTVKVGASNSTSQGQWITSRVAASGAGAVSLYWNGSMTPFDSNTNASIAIPTVTFWVFDENNGAPSVDLPTHDEMSMAFIGGGLSAVEQASAAARFNSFMTNLATPINVYT